MCTTRTRRCVRVVLGCIALGLGAVPAGLATEVAGASSPATGAAAGPVSGEVGTAGVQPEIMLHCWGPMWYLRGRSVYDPVTTAKGAADGSAYIVLQQNKKASAEKTWWVFVSGNMMYVFSTAPVVSTPQTTTTPGDVLESHPGQVSKLGVRPIVVNKLLRRVYEYSRAAGGEPIRHVPFLAGEGWPHPGGTTGRGAWAAKAKTIVERMDLNPVFLNSDGAVVTGAAAQGYVLWQNPPGGTLLQAGASDVVTLLVGGPDTPPGEPDKGPPCTVVGGNSFFNAGPVTLAGTTESILCGVNTNGIDWVTVRCGTETSTPVAAPEVFWKILPAGAARTVQIKVPADDDCTVRGALRVSVWACAEPGAPPPCAFTLPGPTACRAGDFGPPESVFLEFALPAGNTGYLVAEDPYGGSIDVRLVAALK